MLPTDALNNPFSFSIIFRFPNPPQVIAQPLATVCDPYLNLFRGIIPPLGGTIDLSPILAFITLDVSLSLSEILHSFTVFIIQTGFRK